jgi:hypothetical protein
VDRSLIPKAKPLNKKVSLLDGSCFLHISYHPQYATHQELQSLFKISYKDTFKDDDDNFNMSQMII